MPYPPNKPNGKGDPAFYARIEEMRADCGNAEIPEPPEGTALILVDGVYCAIELSTNFVYEYSPMYGGMLWSRTKHDVIQELSERPRFDSDSDEYAKWEGPY